MLLYFLVVMRLEQLCTDDELQQLKQEPELVCRYIDQAGEQVPNSKLNTTINHIAQKLRANGYTRETFMESLENTPIPIQEVVKPLQPVISAYFTGLTHDHTEAIVLALTRRAQQMWVDGKEITHTDPKILAIYNTFFTLYQAGAKIEDVKLACLALAGKTLQENNGWSELDQPQVFHVP